MKSNKILTIIIIILSICILILGGYILYDKVLDKDTFTSNNDSNIIIDDDDDLISNNEALMIVKDLTKKYFEYKHSLGPYCGEANAEDYIEFGSYETYDFRDYWASNTFKSINDIKEYYMSIMTDELIPTYLNDGVSYIEQEGKLYCQLSHKGCGDIYNENASMFTISSIESNMIVVDVILSSETCGSLLTRREGTIEVVKKTNGNWVISKYELQISDLN